MTVHGQIVRSSEMRAAGSMRAEDYEGGSQACHECGFMPADHLRVRLLTLDTDDRWHCINTKGCLARKRRQES